MAEQEQTLSVTPLDGKTTLNDKMFFEPERLAYVSSAGIAEQIAGAVEQRLPKPERPPVVITSGELLTDLSNLAAAQAMLASARQQYASCMQLGKAINLVEEAGKKLIEEGPERLTALSGAIGTLVPAAAPVMAALTGALGIISLFRENVDLSGVKTDMDQLTFRILVAAKLKEKEFTVRLYDTELPPQTPDSSPLLKALHDAEAARAEAWAALAPHLAALAHAQAKLDAAARVTTPNAAALDAAAKDVTAKRQTITPVTNLLDRADAQLASLRAHLEKIDDKTGLMTLGRLIRAETIKTAQAFILHVGVVAAGGHHRVSNTLWRTSARVSAMGGTVARWALLRADGSFETGGMFQGRESERFPE